MIKKADDYTRDFVIKYEEILSDIALGVPFHDAEKKAFIDTVIFICNRLIAEIKEIAEMRHAKSDLALMAIVKEQDQKWKAVARRLYAKKLSFDVHSDAFQIVWNQFKTQFKHG